MFKNLNNGLIVARIGHIVAVGKTRAEAYNNLVSTYWVVNHGKTK